MFYAKKWAPTHTSRHVHTLHTCAHVHTPHTHTHAIHMHTDTHCTHTHTIHVHTCTLHAWTQALSRAHIHTLTQEPTEQRTQVPFSAAQIVTDLLTEHWFDHQDIESVQLSPRVPRFQFSPDMTGWQERKLTMFPKERAVGLWGSGSMFISGKICLQEDFF